MAKKNCVICGGEGYSYLNFCWEHLQEKNAGKIVKCGSCGTWHYLDSICECQMPPAKTAKQQVIEKQNFCSNCGKLCGKYDLCYDCYRRKSEEDLKRYIEELEKNNENLVESEKDSGVDIRDKWPAKIRTKNGTKVRSHAECRIADWLSTHSIVYEYENKVHSTSDKTKYLLSDFYIPDARIYIEYWGYKDRETYNKRRKEKMAIYDERKFIVKDLEDYHLEVLDDSMKEILLEYLPDDLQDKLR